VKEIASFIFVMLVLTWFTPASFAEVVQGPIESIDRTKNEIVVKNKTSGADTVVLVHPKVISTLQNRSVVKVSLKPGTNTADTVEVKIG
jgi:hypothetical protein